MKRSNIRDWKR